MFDLYLSIYLLIVVLIADASVHQGKNFTKQGDLFTETI